MNNAEKITKELNIIEDFLNGKMQAADRPSMVAVLNLIEIFLLNQNEIANSLRLMRTNGIKTGS